MGDDLHVVTGAFGFSGKYIAKRLLDAGRRVRTITNSPHRSNPFQGRVEAYPYNFDHPDKLADSLEGAAVLYNNYWVRFNYPGFSYSRAIENTLTLFSAARVAGVGKIVHVSIANPSEESPFEYYRGKAKLERALKESGLHYSILRPAVLFGREDILINNIAWFLRHFPVFGVFGDGRYRLQPIYVDDLAELAVKEGQNMENRIIDAIGPETFSYRELVEEIGRIIGHRRPVVPIPRDLGYFIGVAVGRVLNDITLTHDEIEGLMAGLLCTDSPPAGKTKLTEWAGEHALTLGKRYASELARRKNRTAAYDQL
ncbi:MAG: NAD(P)H-binding protein [Candidatus Sulfobium sp.]|jgi:uncharacterized protein YbjT (DUF2867 family)